MGGPDNDVAVVGEGKPPVQPQPTPDDDGGNKDSKKEAYLRSAPTAAANQSKQRFHPGLPADIRSDGSSRDNTPRAIQAIVNYPGTNDWMSKEMKGAATANKATDEKHQNRIVRDYIDIGGHEQDAATALEPPELNRQQPRAGLQAGAYSASPGQQGYLQRLDAAPMSAVGIRVEEEPRGSTPVNTAAGANREGGNNNATMLDGQQQQIANLAEATPVQDPEVAGGEAQPVSEEDRRESDVVEKRRLVGLSLVMLVLVVLVCVLLFSLVLKDNHDNSAQPADGSLLRTPTGSPSLAPMSLETYFLSLLPDYTIDSIQDGPNSIQAQAFQWMLEDLAYNPLISADRFVQRFSLVTLYLATNSLGWLKSGFWLNHTIHECEWHNGKDFAMKGLMGRFIPRYMVEFFPPTEPQPTRCNETNGMLLHLWLDQNNLYGQLPLEFYLLTTLQTLSVGFQNRLKGPISSHIGQLTELEGLVMDNMVEGLRVDGEFIGNSGTIPSQIGLLTKLKGLSLGNLHAGTLPTELGLLTDIQTLHLPNKFLEGPLPDITLFPKLRSFFVNENALTGTIPTEIGEITTLEFFAAGTNKLHGTLPSQLGLLTKLELLSLYFNQLEGTLPTQLGLMTASTLLAYNYNQFSGTIPSQFGRLTNLSVIVNINGNPLLTGTIPTQLGLLSNLYSLKLRHNSLTGPIPSEFGMLESLGEILLDNNYLSGTIPETLGSPQQQSLYMFDVGNNLLLSGTMPASLCSLNGTCMQHPLRFTKCIEGTHLAFNCSDFFCGCDCPCVDSSTNSTV